ncbi:MAG: hypothetical protein LBD97_05610, partial [Bifidobacteriaceae bacterium]|jgi:hypothetical protein|nr:hypothetical protein [Bifidobacteriaceae bacterium]
VEFPEGVAAEDLTVSKSGTDLVFHYPGGSLKYATWLICSPMLACFSTSYKPAAFRFADGTEWSLTQVLAIVPS